MLLVGILLYPRLRTFRAEPVKKSPCRYGLDSSPIIVCSCLQQVLMLMLMVMVMLTAMLILMLMFMLIMKGAKTVEIR